jgi:hypothetical protein
LDEALQRADANPNGSWSGVNPTRMQMNTQSGVNAQELSGLATGMYPATMRNRLLGIAGLGALALAGGALAVMALGQPEEKVKEIRVIEAPEGADAASDQVPAAGNKADQNTEKAPDDSVIALDALPEEGEEDAKKSGTSSPSKTTSPKASATTAKKPPSSAPKPAAVPESTPKPAASPSGNWKFDAGF